MSLDFNTLLAQAAELKEAQLRETRREYEAAPECLRYTLAYSRDAAVIALRQGPAPVRLHAAEEHKAAGNAALQADPCDAAKALEHYTRALALLCWFEKRSSDPHDERVTLVNSARIDDSDPLSAEACRLHATTLLNAARAYETLARHTDARAACDAVMAALEQASNVGHTFPHTERQLCLAKTLYWRATASAADGTRAGLRAAAADLAKAAELAPRDAKIVALRRTIGSHLAQAQADERSQCSAMFSKSGLYEDVGAAAPAGIPDDVPSACLSRSDRETAVRRRVARVRGALFAFFAARAVWMMHKTGLLQWIAALPSPRVNVTNTN